MTMHSIYGAVSPYFRRRRFRWFERQMRHSSSNSILYVGWTEGFWAESNMADRVALLNTEEARFGKASKVGTHVVGDGCALPFGDRSFDIVFSNSVIEHVGTWDRQEQFASEAR